MYFPYSGKEMTVPSPNDRALSLPHQILLLPITLDWFSFLIFSLLAMFGTLHSWSSLWSLYCLGKAFVKSQALFNWGLILLAVTSLIMDLAGRPCRDLLSPSSYIAGRRLSCELWCCFSFVGFQQREVIQSEGSFSPWSFSSTFPLKRTHAVSVTPWISYHTEEGTAITTMAAAPCFQDTRDENGERRDVRVGYDRAAYSWGSHKHPTLPVYLCVDSRQSSASYLYRISSTAFLTHKSTINVC